MEECHQVPISDVATYWRGNTSNDLLGAPGAHSSTDSGSDSHTAQVTMLPCTTSLERFLWSIQWFAAHGLYVILSNNPANTGSCAGSLNGTEAANAEDFAGAWSELWRAVTALPRFDADFRGRVLLQLLQGPADAGCIWEEASSVDGKGQVLPGM